VSIVEALVERDADRSSGGSMRSATATASASTASISALHPDPD
jgi:hypothetical protein